MARAQENRAAFRDRAAALRNSRLQIAGRDLGLRRDVPQIEADTFHVAVFQGVLVDGSCVFSEMTRRVDVRPP